MQLQGEKLKLIRNDLHDSCMTYVSPACNGISGRSRKWDFPPSLTCPTPKVTLVDIAQFINVFLKSVVYVEENQQYSSTADLRVDSQSAIRT